MNRWHTIIGTYGIDIDISIWHVYPSHRNPLSRQKSIPPTWKLKPQCQVQLWNPHPQLVTGDPNCESPPKRGGFADHSTSLFFANFNNSRATLFKVKRIHLNEHTTKTKLLAKKNRVQSKAYNFEKHWIWSFKTP